MKRIAAAIIALLSSDAAYAANRYVTANGSPSSDCTVGSPCTIQRAANIVNPGDVVLVADGVYTTTSTGYLLTIRRGGTATDKVIFKAMNKWGAKLWGRRDTSLNCIRVEADHVRLEGFDIFEFRDIGVYNVSGNFFELVGNHIHHIARTFCSSDPIGRDGYYSQGTHDILIEGNLFNDIGRLVPGENGCSASVIRGDQGLYMSGTRITVRNNVFYNMRTGWPIQLYPSSSSEVRIYANTFGGYMQDGGTVGQIALDRPCSGLYVKNNIFYQTRKYLVKMQNTTTTGEVYNNLTDVAVLGIIDRPQAGVLTQGNIVNTDPVFASVAAVGGVLSGSPDFHLQDVSPAIDAGVPLAELTTDFEGNSRPQRGAYDIGCYEKLGSGADLIRPARITDLSPF